MATLTEGIYVDDIVAIEFDKTFNREYFVAEGALVRGQIVKTGTAGTQKAPVVAAGTGANAIALEPVADGARGVFLVRGPAVVKKSGLTYGPSANGSNKTATEVLLAAVGIIVRDTVPAAS
jgi:hypothetical protein